MQGWRVDDEHAQTSTGDDAGEVVWVSDDVTADGEGKLRFDSENL